MPGVRSRPGPRRAGELQSGLQTVFTPAKQLALFHQNVIFAFCFF